VALKNEGFINVIFNVPDLEDQIPATERQKELVRIVLTEEFDTSKLTKSQASLIVDINSYISGVWHAKTDKREHPHLIVRTLAIAAILNEERVWKAIRNWGRERHRKRRDEAIPKLRQNSELFQQVWSTMYQAVKSREQDMIDVESFSKINLRHNEHANNQTWAAQPSMRISALLSTNDQMKSGYNQHTSKMRMQRCYCCQQQFLRDQLIYNYVWKGYRGRAKSSSVLMCPRCSTQATEYWKEQAQKQMRMAIMSIILTIIAVFVIYMTPK
jgi:hypothetical protein